MLQEEGLMIPDREECMRMLKENGVPDNIIAHSKAVAEIALEYGRKIKANGEKVNLRLLEAAALLHDVCKHESLTKGNEEERDHGAAGARLLEKKDMPEVADVVGSHMMDSIFIPGKLDSLEKKLVYYADKLVNPEGRVTWSKRLEYLNRRYPSAVEKFKRADPMIRKLEKEIKSAAGVKE